MIDPAKAFSARAIYALKSDVLFRVYPGSSDLYFVRIGGQGFAGGVSSGLRAQLGILGALLGALFEKKVAQNLAAKTSGLDGQDPASLIHQNKGSFIQESFDITASSIDPRAFWRTWGTVR